MCGIALVWAGVRLSAASPLSTSPPGVQQVSGDTDVAAEAVAQEEKGSSQLAELDGTTIQRLTRSTSGAVTEAAVALQDELTVTLGRRGPDSTGVLAVEPLPEHPPAALVGCTLGLRCVPATQPATTPDGTVRAAIASVIIPHFGLQRGSSAVMRLSVVRRLCYGTVRFLAGMYKLAQAHRTPAHWPPRWRAMAATRITCCM